GARPGTAAGSRPAASHDLCARRTPVADRRSPDRHSSPPGPATRDTYTDHMAVLHAAGTPLTTSGYTLLIADDPTQVAAAQRLRHEVFATELGANLRPDVTGLDVD